MSLGVTKQHTAGVSLPLQTLLADIESKTLPFQEETLEILKEKAKSEFKQREQCVTFQVGNQELAVPIQALLEVGQCPPVIPLPNVPQWVLGITHIRGDIISVVDFSLLFHLKRSRREKNEYYILLHAEGIKIGFVVDRLTGVLGVEEENKQRLYPDDEGLQGNDISSFISFFVQAGNREVALLDYSKFLTSPMLNDLDLDLAD
ncbi:chemotaxis protein CheW [Desulfogranum japonicum]|uniref:chemotaxis protein CheW n=1 Tax=Desulfogranum japonicum TaxID=231447 RepID=UPI000421B97C|nr:chemotaxis protein CheW [Desulfogranum japonicum]